MTRIRLSKLQELFDFQIIDVIYLILGISKN